MKTALQQAWWTMSLSFICATIATAENSTTKPFDREQTKDVVRVILLKVDRTTVFTDKGFRNEKQKEIHAVPGLSVAYVVEILGNESITNRISGSVSVFVGKTSLSQSLPENLAGGGISGVRAYRQHRWGAEQKKPEVQNPKRAQICETWLRGVRVPNGQLDLHIETGFNQHKETFIFKNIPVE